MFYLTHAVLFFVCIALANSSFAQEATPLTISGKVRVYNNHRDRQAPIQNTDAFSVGGSLSVKSPHWWGLRIGGTLFLANSLGLNNSDPARQSTLLPARDIAVLGESYLAYENSETSVEIGRLIVNTPFANSSDAFMIPVTFLGGASSFQFEDGWRLKVGVLDQIKNRETEEFVDTGEFITNRLLGAASRRATAMDFFVGVTQEDGQIISSIWNYYLSDLFNLAYVDASYSIEHSEKLKSIFSLQGGHQAGVGSGFPGSSAVNSNLMGLQYALSWLQSKMSLGFNIVPEASGAFKNGAWVSPFCFFTDPLFTNSMASGMGNSFPGQAYKLTLENSSLSRILFRLSHSRLEFLPATSSASETDVWIKYSPEQLKDFSVWLRSGFLATDNSANNLNEYRVQFEYLF